MMCKFSDQFSGQLTRVPSKSPATHFPLGLDLYTQAQKALSFKPPFDSDDSQSPILPGLTTELSNLLSKDLDSRKKRTNSHLGTSRKARASAIWVETEDYFREFGLNDVEKLRKLGSLGVLGNDKRFLIPGLGNAGVEFRNSVEKDDNEGDLSGVEWLLGCKEKVHLTIESPSKKRKIVDVGRELEKVFVSCPVNGSKSLCDYCCVGDNGDELNRLLVCRSCETVVHRKCYGVVGDIDSSWLCDWCKTSKLGGKEMVCVLCPRKGGALKPVSRNANEFCHLFCCQWIPEVYVEDMRTMETVMNIEGIKDSRMNLVCSVCKLNSGVCIRCSNGTCRSLFHPICGREAGHKMEIWGKFGCDDVELQAYCYKHSIDHNVTNSEQLEQPSVTRSSDSQEKLQTVTPTMTKPNKLKFGRRNGDKVDLPNEEGLPDTRSSSRVEFKCDEAQRPVSALESMVNVDVSTSDSLDCTIVLKKLIDRGKVNLNDIASEIGVSPDSLAFISSENNLVPDLRGKLITWLRNNAHIGSLPKKLKVRIKSSSASKEDRAAVKDSNSSLVALSDGPEESVPSHRRSINVIKILKGNEIISSVEVKTGDESVMEMAKSGEVTSEDADNSAKEHASAPTEKLVMEPDEVCEKLTSHSPKCEEGSQDQGITTLKQNTVLDSVLKQPCCSAFKLEDLSSSYIHPVIREKIFDMENAVLPVFATYEVDGSRNQGNYFPEVSTSINELIEHLNSDGKISRFDRSKLEQLADARNIGLLKTSPRDEVEGELLFHQNRLLSNAVTAKCIADNMISEMVKSLPQEIDFISKRKWDAVTMNHYMSELKEVKKQGRKERRQKEAQEVLSSATAAAAASSRISSLRKAISAEPAHQEGLMKVNTSAGRPGPYSQQMSWAKETVSTEMKSGSVKPVSKLEEEFRNCDICRRSDTLLNPILECSGCKVAVHLDCYRSVNDYAGPWYCELCEEELSSRRPQVAVECGLCGETTGAFRKSADGQWVHAFCAEWVLEAAYRRGQMTPVEGMESVVKGSECHICHRKHGACIKCSYGHCQSMFHPSCARTAGLYMTVKSSGSKLQNKAYCQKHSLEQRAKALNQRHGVEELKSLKQIRVEMERLRLLCERIIRREKLKRELVLCSQDILVSKRETAAISTLVHSPFFPTDISSESATTSLKGNTDDCQSGNEVIQRGNTDVTVDSTVPGKRRIKFPLTMDNGRKADDSSTSHLVTQKPRERVVFAGKRIPQRPASVSITRSDSDEEKRSKLKKA